MNSASLVACTLTRSVPVVDYVLVKRSANLPLLASIAVALVSSAHAELQYPSSPGLEIERLDGKELELCIEQPASLDEQWMIQSSRDLSVWTDLGKMNPDASGGLVFVIEGSSLTEGQVFFRAMLLEDVGDTTTVDPPSEEDETDPNAKQPEEGTPENEEPDLAQSVGGPLLAAQDDLNAARTQWSNQAFADYQYSILNGKGQTFWAGDVTVVQGVIDSTSKTSGNVDDTTGLPTIDGLFDIIQAAIDASADQIDVTYDPEFGYPVTGYIDYVSILADEERSFQVTNFLAPPG